MDWSVGASSGCLHSVSTSLFAFINSRPGEQVMNKQCSVLTNDGLECSSIGERIGHGYMSALD